MAGAMCGIEGIPKHWLGKLAWREHLYQVAKDPLTNPTQLPSR